MRLLLVLLLGKSNTEVQAWTPSTSLKSISYEQALSTRKSNSLLGPLRTSRSEETEEDDSPVPISALRVSEIKQELEALKVDYTDCFDKESMVVRLLDARNRNDEDDEIKNESTSSDEITSASSSSCDSSEATAEDTEVQLEEIRNMRVKELREELGRRRIPRAGLFDKEDLVQALLKAKQLEAVFSPTGNILPGCVADLSGDQVEQELQHKATPMLLDVYATWCGPCQMMAPQLEQAAQDSFNGGDASKPLIRVAKMDSDEHPQMASQLKVSGLPTLVLFQYGEEVSRIEGALMKDQLVEWVGSKLR